MNLPLNKNSSTVMHIDLNSCFATVEQQAYPTLRGKPIAIAAYTTPGGCILAPSIEAKEFGIKVGMTVREAKLLCPQLIVRDPDPIMVRHIHLKLKQVLSSYSPFLTPKSIDEYVIEFKDNASWRRGLVNIGLEIKKRIRKEVGEWIRVNIGISTNRFLAKLAASLHKPDGLDVITHKNLKKTYAKLTLIDLHGINTRFQARLNAQGIFTPLEFLNASLETLQHKVFKSICGYYWYLRLRGWEIDAIDFERKSFGQSYALGKQTADRKEIARILMKLCEKMGRRLRHHNFSAHGIHVACVYADLTHWHMGKTFPTSLYTTSDLYNKAIFILNQQQKWKKLRELAVSCFHLTPTNPEQLDLFQSQFSKKINVQKAADLINDKWGEYIITPALMLGMKDVIIDRIAFGGAKDLENY